MRTKYGIKWEDLKDLSQSDIGKIEDFFGVFNPISEIFYEEIENNRLKRNNETWIIITKSEIEICTR